MSTSKATPGPWGLQSSSSAWHIMGPRGVRLFTVHDQDPWSSSVARLAVSAPELRDALRELCDYVGPVDYRAPSSGAPKCIRTARALLARLDAEVTK